MSHDKPDDYDNELSLLGHFACKNWPTITPTTPSACQRISGLSASNDPRIFISPYTNPVVEPRCELSKNLPLLFTSTVRALCT